LTFIELCDIVTVMEKLKIIKLELETAMICLDLLPNKIQLNEMYVRAWKLLEDVQNSLKELENNHSICP